MKDILKRKTEEVAKVRDVSGNSAQLRARRREGEKEAATQKRSLGSQDIRALELALQAKTEEVVALVKEASRYIST